MREQYTVNQLAQAAGVSVRALHYYDTIDLLKPATRSRAGYRYYGRKELLKLQQILFYKQLGFTLEEIRNVFDVPNFDLLTALETHRKEFLSRSEELKKLLQTVDLTIEALKENKEFSPEQIYSGFLSEKASLV